MEISVENLETPAEAPQEQPEIPEEKAEIQEEIQENEEIQEEIPAPPPLVRQCSMHPEPKKRGRPKAAPKPKPEPKKRGRPPRVVFQEEPQVQEYVPPTQEQLTSYVTPLLQAYAAHLQMNQANAKRQRYRELFSSVYGNR